MTVSVDAVCYFRIQNPILSVTAVSDAHMSTRLLAQTTLRNLLGVRYVCHSACRIIFWAIDYLCIVAKVALQVQK